MSTLAQEQRRLREAIVSGADANGLLGAASRLHIYRHAYPARLAAALRDNYGVLLQAMGDEAFDALAQAYLAAYPSRHPSIRWFGDRLPEFMVERAELVPHPAFIDLARMEWALRAAFDAEDAPVLLAATLAALPAERWPDLVLRLHPSLQVLDLQWHVEPAWRALQHDSKAELPEPEAGQHTLLVWRPELETKWRSARDETEVALIAGLRRREPFAALCELAERRAGPDQGAPLVAVALQQWIDEGLLAGQ